MQGCLHGISVYQNTRSLKKYPQLPCTQGEYWIGKESIIDLHMYTEFVVV